MKKVLVAGVFTALAALLVTGVALAQRSDEVATVAGHAVTRDELLFHMRRLAPRVQDRDGKAGGRLAARALDEIRRDKTALILATEQGLIASPGHAAFLADLAAENERRAAALARREVVYGLARFTPEQYYSHRLTGLTTALKQRLGELRVTDAEVRRAFDADRDAWRANATTYTYTQLVVPVPDGHAEALQRRVAGADRLTDLKEPGARLTTATHEGGGSAVHDRDLMAVLGELEPGQISAPVPGTGQITYYELTGKTVDEEAAFTTYSPRIRQSLIEEKFAQLLQRRVAGSGFEVDQAAVDAINAEDVQQ
ncbi:hypothetical protein SAMN05444920_11017 [Nonomuraea solani]|uniref:SurA N-terminal domain-containing protein n=1 Tax=Nonomuraea solani TaxID=1144553 RepID=A0A1H6EFN2_9ACTN|nr:peptidyl-prolyl cis-trans isomerase [Nonomuraea solani]SEG96608.1 hypothetical protein SAMN05444920_11017 [Nonomuraea solani]